MSIPPAIGASGLERSPRLKYDNVLTRANRLTFGLNTDKNNNI